METLLLGPLIPQISHSTHSLIPRSARDTNLFLEYDCFQVLCAYFPPTLSAVFIDGVRSGESLSLKRREKFNFAAFIKALRCLILEGRVPSNFRFRVINRFWANQHVRSKYLCYKIDNEQCYDGPNNYVLW